MGSINPVWILVVLATGGALITVGKWIGGMDKFRSSVEGAIVDIKNSISTIQGDIKSILGALPPQPVSRTSPLTLTELGKDISQELDVSSWATNEATGVVNCNYCM